MTDKTLSTECKCDKCISICSNSCGWFGSIDEVLGAADIMQLPINGFVHEYLIREWYYAETIEIPAPRKNFDRYTGSTVWHDKLLNDEIRANGKGFVRASWGHNLMIGYACIFLTDDNLCMIHESKPYECKKTFGCKGHNTEIRHEIEDYWKEHQEWVMGFVI